jgi:hypothetical protein
LSQSQSLDKIAPETLSASGKVNRYVSTTHPLKL